MYCLMIRNESAVFCLLFLSSFFIRTAFPFICILWMIHTLILKEASLPIAPTTQHNNRATPGESGGLYRRNMTAPDVSLYLGCGDIFSSAWILTLKIGAMFWQGPHHVAVKSTTTNLFPAFFRALSKADCREGEKLIQFPNWHDTFLPAEVHWNGRWWVIMLWFNWSDWDFQIFPKEPYVLWLERSDSFCFLFEILKLSSNPF